MSTSTLLQDIPLRTRADACCADVREPSLGESQTDRLAARLKAVADPTRLRMLDLLAQQPQPLCVCDVTTHFPQNQPTISHHLRLLREAGLIDTEKRGIWAYYWATDAGKSLLGAVTAQP